MDIIHSLYTSLNRACCACVCVRVCVKKSRILFFTRTKVCNEKKQTLMRRGNVCVQWGLGMLTPRTHPSANTFWASLSNVEACPTL